MKINFPRFFLVYVIYFFYLCTEIGFLGHLCALSRKHL